MARAQTDPDTQPDAAEAKADTVTLAVAHPYDELVLHDVTDADGKPYAITAAGTEVSVKDEAKIRDAAKAERVTIRKVK